MSIHFIETFSVLRFTDISRSVTAYKTYSLIVVAALSPSD